MKIDAERLRGFLDCMHDEADERDKRSVQIREIVKAAKEAGYDTKAVRKVFARERMDEGERSRQDDLLETYEAVLGPKGAALRAIEAGAPVGEAAAENGVHRATLARARSGNFHVAKQPSNATVANEPSIATRHDADGVITDTSPKAPDASSTVTARAPEEEARQEEEVAAGRDAIPGLGVADRSATSPGGSEHRLPALDRSAVVPLGCNTHPQPDEVSTGDQPSPCLACRNEGSVIDGICGACGAHEEAPTESLGAVARPSSAERVASTINPDEDDLKIPFFLTKAGQRASAPSKEK